MCLERPRKQFSPVWWSSRARLGLFICLERSWKQFSPVWWSCKARISLFMDRKRSKNSFHLSAGPVKLVRPVYLPGKIDKVVFVTVEVL